MKISRLLLSAGCLAMLAGCGGSEDYRLSAEQLAWQGYQEGQVLRFAQRPAGPVRTYRIGSITDVMERQNQGINFTLLPRKDINCENLTVTALRTDSVATELPVLNLQLTNNSGDISLWATASWERFNGLGLLPLDEINQGSVLDTLRYPGVRLLPAATFGGVPYAPVVRLRNTYTPPIGPAPKLIQTLYYAKGKGVVAYEEAGALWYRLP